MYDAVRMVAKALDDISATADTLRIDPIQCEQGQPWLEGDKLMSYIQRVINIVIFLTIIEICNAILRVW